MKQQEANRAGLRGFLSPVLWTDEVRYVWVLLSRFDGSRSFWSFLD